MTQDEQNHRLHALAAIQIADVSSLLLIVGQLAEIVRAMPRT